VDLEAIWRGENSDTFKERARSAKCIGGRRVPRPPFRHKRRVLANFDLLMRIRMAILGSKTVDELRDGYALDL
jgi:hypothetical protein